MLYFPGVTVLLEEPSAEGVNTTSMFSEKFEEEVYPPDVEKSTDPTKTGASWSESTDKAVTRYGKTLGTELVTLSYYPILSVKIQSQGVQDLAGFKMVHQWHHYLGWGLVIKFCVSLSKECSWILVDSG